MAMQSTLIILLLCAALTATHIGLATNRVRAWAIGRFGENGWLWIYGFIAAVMFSATTAYYAAHQFDGPRGPDLGAVPALRWLLIAGIAAGMMLMGSTFAHYFNSPYAVLIHNFREPYGVERITRHPFFAGMVMLGSAHALLASNLNGSVLFLSLAVMAAGGAYHQDAKLLRRGGEAYRRFLETTSFVPFAAIIAGRQTIVWRELPIAVMAAGLVAAAVLRWVHDSIFAYGGLFVIVAVVGGSALIALVSSFASRSQSEIAKL